MIMVFRMCKVKIERKSYESKEKMMEMLDVFYAGERLDMQEYEELVGMLAAE